MRKPVGKSTSTLLGTSLLLLGAAFLPLGLAAQQARDASTAAAPDEPLPQTTNLQAKDFVDRANRLIQRRNAFLGEFERGATALGAACEASAGNEVAAKRAGLTVAQGVQPGAGADLRVDQASQTAPLGRALEQVRNDLGEQRKRRCSGFRVPGQRSDACVVLDMASEWGNQAQVFLVQHRAAREREMQTDLDLQRLGQRGCLAPEVAASLQERRGAGWTRLDIESEALLRAAVDRLKVLSTPPR